MADFILSAFADEASSALEGQIAALKRNGLSHIEIRNVDGRSVVDLSDEELTEVHKKLEKAGISVSAIGSPIGKIQITDAFAPHFERFKRTVRAAQILGTKRIRMFSFFIPKGENTEQYRDEVLSRLRQLCGYAKEQGVFCCHENEKEIYGDCCERLHVIYDTLGDSIRGIYDPANNIQCGEVPADVFPGLLAHTDYLHVKDALLADGCVVPAGDGDGSIPELLDRFYKPSAGQILSVEPHLVNFVGLSALQAEELVHRYAYATADDAFDAAVDALKRILKERGYSYE